MLAGVQGENVLAARYAPELLSSIRQRSAFVFDLVRVVMRAFPVVLNAKLCGRSSEMTCAIAMFRGQSSRSVSERRRAASTIFDLLQRCTSCVQRPLEAEDSDRDK